MRKKYIVPLLALALAVAAVGCGKTDNGETDKEVKENIEKSKENIEKDESEDGFTYKEVEDGICLTKYNGNGGALVVPDEMGGKSVVQLEDGLFSEVDVESLEIPDSVRLIAGKITKNNNTVIKCNRSTAAYEYAYQYGYGLELLGDNETQANEVSVYDKEGALSEEIEIGKKGTTDVTKGISLEEEDGVSVLHLNGSSSGQIVVEDYTTLVIELEEGSVNTITASGGEDGIVCKGNLTIRGKGSLSVTGGDYHSRREGDGASVGCGVYVLGDLTIEDGANVGMQCGNSNYYSTFSLLVDGGNFKVNSASVELKIPEGENPASNAAVMAGEIGTVPGVYGNIILENCSIKEGGQVVEYQYQNKDCMTVTAGRTIGPEGNVCYSYNEVTDEYDKQSAPMATYVKIQ